MQRKKSEADLAVEILFSRQEPINYRELILEVAERMGRKKDSLNLTSIFTRLNLDNRLIYQGEGYWYFDTNRPPKEK